MWAYNTIKVPKPSEFALAQSSTVYYADGSTEMGKFAEIDRVSVDASTLPDYVGNSVVASEDRSFYSNQGVDPKGIARALVNNLRGGDTQGASTLTQQYVKNYYVDTTSSYSGKFKQAIMAIKIDREKSKKDILGDYLNTVYFGRGSYGIEAASKAFFDKSAKDLSPSETALLAGILPSPSAWDPAENPEKAQERWSRVLQFMADDGYITQEQYNTAKQTGMPHTIEPQTKQVYAGSNGYLLQMVRTELQDKAGLSPEQIDTGGFKIVTTINNKDQAAAAHIMEDQQRFGGASPNLRKALVSIDPTTGGLLALYGGENYLTSQVNTATDAIAQAGSTFKPFALVAALENGWALESTYPATSPMTIEGHEFQNFKNVSLKSASLTQATEQSLNTPYLQLNQDLSNQVDPQATAEVANRAGYPKNTAGLKSDEEREFVQNVLGSASPHTIDIASAYSTFAAQGVKRDPHIVATVKNPDGKDHYTAATAGKREFEEDVMSETTYALEQVVSGENGSADKVEAAMDRPVAAKTGSSSDNKSAQFVGFTPQVVTAVTLYQTGDDGAEESITPWGEYDEITGSTYPADIFIDYMKVAHEGLEVKEFPERAVIPPTRGGSTEKPTAEPEDEETRVPTGQPEETQAPTAEPTPEATQQGTQPPGGEPTSEPSGEGSIGGGDRENPGGGGGNDRENPGGGGGNDRENPGGGGGNDRENPGGGGGNDRENPGGNNNGNRGGAQQPAAVNPRGGVR